MKKNKNPNNYNLKEQEYKTIKLKLINRLDYSEKKAKRFTLNNTNQNVWIPNKHLLEDGTLIEGENIDYIFIRSKRQMKIAKCWDKFKRYLDNEDRDVEFDPDYDPYFLQV